MNDKVSIRWKVFKALGLLTHVLPLSFIGIAIKYFLLARLVNGNPEKSLRFLLDLDNFLYWMTGQKTVEYGSGMHVKQRFTGYIDNLLEKAVNSGGPFLDVGCGHGEVANRLAELTQDRVVGVDLNQRLIRTAKQNNTSSNLEFKHGDITTNAVIGQFKTIILSNVLEHIEDRTQLLRDLFTRYGARRLVIRVPNFERDWRVPLKRELGVPYFLDNTHEIEHTLEQLRTELHDAGYTLSEVDLRWGEIWGLAKKDD